MLWHKAKLQKTLPLFLVKVHPREPSRDLSVQAAGFAELKKDLIHSARLGRFSVTAANYTSSIDSDPVILKEVVRVNMAHVVALAKEGVIEESMASSLLKALRKVPADLKLDPMLEDVHSSIEQYVAAQIGNESGGMLNLAKSRNDQVATALRMALRTKLLKIGKELARLEAVLARKGEENSAVLMPGYTHLQRAQTVTVGHHLLAYADMLVRSSERLFECYARVNNSPMGAGALASSSFNPDRELVASLLGFEGLVTNSLDAVSSRDFAIESIYICAQIMNDLSRLSEEIVLWSSTEFSFAKVSDAYASTSSMMPQKKNAIVPEIARARSSQVAADLVASLGIMKSLPLAYNLDLQELSKNLWSAVDKTLSTISIFSDMIEGLSFNIEELSNAVRADESIFSTEVADYLVRKYKIPFRLAHQRVGALAKQAQGKKIFSSLDEVQLRKFLGVGISQKEIKELINGKLAVSRRLSIGSPNPKLVSQQSKNSLLKAASFSKILDNLENSLRIADANLSKQIDLVQRNSR